ncbi:MAG: inorganic phosphate transporter [Bacteroidaceae bacterium]|nr:inorganic phosphate transporter [Bacteroidaceae bacterium]
MSSIFFMGIVGFLIVLAVFDLVVGVSNDAVNFLNSAIGAKVARFKTILLVAAVGVFAGAAMSNGMMDVARHGIMTPMHLSFYDVMCVFLAVMVTDVILLDIFNTLGMPTSTTVSLVFELMGGAFAIAIIKILSGATDANGMLLSLGDIVNTEKALSVVLGIFLSVAIAFVMGTLVQWVARMVFSFTYRSGGATKDAQGHKFGLVSSSIKIGVFAGIAVTSIIWFLLIKGLKDSAFMTSELKELISQNTWLILGGGLAVFSVLMTLLSALKVPVLKFVVLLGTFALAMAFAGNDLVNFVGVPLTGLDAYNDFIANGNGDTQGFLMQSLMNSAQTPLLYLVLAGVVMVLALMFSKKAQNVVKTSVDLSRQDEGDEMFGSSATARILVRSASRCATTVSGFVPKRVSQWIDSRFNTDAMVLEDGAAFDVIRAAVNLVLAGLLVAMGTSMKLPLSTTYVTFMVAMGSSLADRAWSRESAVFRITGVLNVIGGWFITAGAAFIFCYLITNAMFFGRSVVMVLAVIIAITLIIRSNLKFSSKEKQQSEADLLFRQLIRSQNKDERWQLLKQHVRQCTADDLDFTAHCYQSVTDAFFQEEYRALRRATNDIEDARKQFKRQRRKEIIGMRKVDPIVAMERNTWYFLTNNAVEQLLYCLKRINDPCREHVGNNFTPVKGDHISEFVVFQKEVVRIFSLALSAIREGKLQQAEVIRQEADKVQQRLSYYRKQVIDHMQHDTANIEASTVFLNIVQESQQLLASLRHLMRGLAKFEE